MRFSAFIYGTYALVGASAAGVGMLCYYGLSMSNEIGARERAALWPQYVHDRIKATYGYLGASLIVSAGAGISVARTPQLLRLVSGGGILVQSDHLITAPKKYVY